MICKNCGKEIPDDAKFCGHCGTPVEKETTETPVVSADMPADTNVDTAADVAAETRADQISDTPSEETKDDSLAANIGDTLKGTAAGKVLLGDDGKLDQKDLKRMGDAAKEGASNVYHAIEWNEFKTFLDIFKDPFGDHALGILPACVVAVAALLINWWALANFFDAFVITLILYAGYFFVQFIGKEEQHFDWKKAFGSGSQMLTIPAISILVMCMFGISMKSSLNKTSTMVTGMTQYLYTLRSSLMIMMVFLFFGMTMYIMGMLKLGKKLNGYISVIVITVIFSISFFFLITEGLNTLFALL